jgi:hypothetical protein
MFELFRKGEILPDGRTNEDEAKLIGEKPPQMDANRQQAAGLIAAGGNGVGG